MQKVCLDAGDENPQRERDGRGGPPGHALDRLQTTDAPQQFGPHGHAGRRLGHRPGNPQHGAELLELPDGRPALPALLQVRQDRGRIVQGSLVPIVIEKLPLDISACRHGSTSHWGLAQFSVR